MSQSGVAVVLVAVLATGAAGGCGTSTVEISKTPMSGMIGGESWTLGTAETVAFLSMSDRFFINAYAETIAPCTGAGSSVTGNYLILNVPKAPGDYALSGSLNETFFVHSNNHNNVATQGRLVVDEVTTTTVTGGGHFQFDSGNYVDGQFVAQICAQ
jgi:hypothetical protein